MSRFRLLCRNSMRMFGWFESRSDKALKQFREQLYRLDPQVESRFGPRLLQREANEKREWEILFQQAEGGLNPKVVLSSFAIVFRSWGASPRHLDLVGQAILIVMQSNLGRVFTLELEAQWRTIYQNILRDFDSSIDLNRRVMVGPGGSARNL
jgi:hemoglobin-like flavoprotein